MLINSEIISSDARLLEIVNSSSELNHIGLDLESNGFHRYQECVCLLQLCIKNKIYLIDTLAIGEIEPLRKILENSAIEKIIHSAQHDIRSIDRDWNFHLKNLFDTSIASAFVGSTRLGLANVLKEQMNIEIKKDKELQRADWTIRPLNDELKEYAATDVLHLFELRELLKDKLNNLGRISWVQEEFSRLTEIRYSPTNKDFLDIKGSKKLNGNGLSILKELHHFRESQAMKRDVPSFRILPDSTLVMIADEPSLDLTQVRGLVNYHNQKFLSALELAIWRGTKAKPIKRKKHTKNQVINLTQKQLQNSRKRLQQLRNWRLVLAKQLDLPPGLLWPAASLQRLARQPDCFDEEHFSEEVRTWQHSEFGSSLRKLINSFSSVTG